MFIDYESIIFHSSLSESKQNYKILNIYIYIQCKLPN